MQVYILAKKLECQDYVVLSTSIITNITIKDSS